MNVFYGRPLALILCITVGGFALTSYGNGLAKIISAVFAILLLCISFLSRFSPYKKLLHWCAFSIALTTLFSFLYFECYFRAEKHFDGNVEIQGTVEQIEPINSYTMKIVLKCEKTDGKRSNYKLLTYLPLENSEKISSGDIVKIVGAINDFGNETTERINFSKGISGRIDNISKIEIIGSKKIHLPTLFAGIREWLSRYIAMMSDAESGDLLTALLIGDREKLSPNIRLDFKRIGISHILALSGMHLAILSMGIGKLLSAFGVKKKSRLFITSAFIIIYMALTGFSSSVLRAGIMMIIYSALFLMSKTKDSFTSLCIAVFLILVFSPHSVFDIALWLSALATLGIIVLSEYISTTESAVTLKKRLFKWFSVGILSSIFAISATIAISLSTFGGISLLGFISTLIFSILIEAVMYLGCLMILIGWIIPIGKIVVLLCDFIIWFAEKLSYQNWVYIRTDSTVLLCLIVILTVLFFCFVILKIKHKEKFVLVIVTAFIFCHIIPLAQVILMKNTTSLTYYSSDYSDDFLLCSKKEKALISSSKYSQSHAYRAMEILNNARVNVLDAFYITHYSRQIEDELEVLLGNVIIRKLYILTPQNSEEEVILHKMERFLGDYSTEIVLVNMKEKFELGDYRITPLYSAAYGEETSMNAFTVSSYMSTVCYISSGLLENSEKSKLYDFLKCSDQAVLGCHGKKYKNKLFLPETYTNLSHLIINSSNLFVTQGHMEEYKKNGCEVFSHPSEVELLN